MQARCERLRLLDFYPSVGFRPVESEQIVIDCPLETNYILEKMNKPSYL